MVPQSNCRPVVIEQFIYVVKLVKIAFEMLVGFFENILSNYFLFFLRKQKYIRNQIIRFIFGR